MESAHFTGRGDFFEVEEAEEELGRAQFLEHPMGVMHSGMCFASRVNCFHCKKDGHG